MSAQFQFRWKAIADLDVEVYDVRKAPFQLYGLYCPWEPGNFKRMPWEAAEKVSENIQKMYTNTAGGRIRFRTDSPFLAIGATYTAIEFPAPCGTALASVSAYCFDLYLDGTNRRILVPPTLEKRGSISSFAIPDGRYESLCDLGSRKMREITLNFPSLVNMSEVYIGLQADAKVEAGMAYANAKPVVFYGSSITNGVSASKPGNTYENILSRKLNMDYINLGFSGSAKAENAMIDYISGLEMQALVFDYDHNAETPEDLRKTHYPALERFRKKQPDTPIIMLSRPNRADTLEEALERVEIIRKSYEKMLANGDKHVHFINGQDIYTMLDSEMMTIDGVHPTDFGFYCMATAIEKVLKQYI